MVQALSVLVHAFGVKLVAFDLLVIYDIRI